MYVLFETAIGFAIFKLLDEKKLEQVDSISSLFEDVDKARNLVKLTHFEKFADVTEGLVASTAIIEGKVPKTLKHALKKSILKDPNSSLMVADTKLGAAIKDKFNLQCVSNTAISELMRGIRSQLDSLLSGTAQQDLSVMRPSLALSLSRYKLKFSPDKVDTMVIQAVCLLDDLDKELNNYIMRCREWYGWHFPELGKMITDNITYARTVKNLGVRENAASADLSDILPEEVEEKVKEAAETSMGTEIADDDMLNICCLCDQIIELSNYRTELYDYLQRRMMAIAPNLTVLVGELVGGRLISHAGSLINLAKHPASTIQLLGAEKALFRALKTKKDTPKYGLIYHSQLVGQCSQKLKGKMSRMLAAKTALAIRVDALGDDTNLNLGMEHRAKLETRLKQLEEGNIRKISGTGKAKAKFEKYHSKSEVFQYHAAADSTLQTKKRKWEDNKEEISENIVKTEEVNETEEQMKDEPTTSSKKKKSKKVKVEEEPVVKIETETTPVKKKAKRQLIVELGEVQTEDVAVERESEKKKKKKSKKMKHEAEW